MQHFPALQIGVFNYKRLIYSFCFFQLSLNSSILLQMIIILLLFFNLLLWNITIGQGLKKSQQFPVLQIRVYHYKWLTFFFFFIPFFWKITIGQGLKKMASFSCLTNMGISLQMIIIIIFFFSTFFFETLQLARS